MTEPEKIQRRREPIHHMKMATLKDWLLNIEQDYINNMHVHSQSPSNTTSTSAPPSPPPPQEQDMPDFEFFNEENKKQYSSAEELFLDGKIIPLQTVHNNHQNKNTTLTPAIDGVSSLSVEEERENPVGNAENSDIISPPHSRRFRSCELNITESMLSEFPTADSTNRSWSLRLKQSKNNYSWLIHKIKASGSFIKSLFTNNPASSEKENPCYCSDSNADNNVEHAAADDDDAADADVIKGLSENLDAINKSLHDDIGGFGSIIRRRSSSFSGVLKRHFSSKGGSNLTMMTSASLGSSSNSSSFSFGWKDLKRRGSGDAAASHVEEVEKSVDAAIAHCKLSQQKGSELKMAPKDAASRNYDVAPTAAQG